MKILSIFILTLFTSFLGIEEQAIDDKAVIVGIARYQTMGALRYTDDDAYRFLGFMKSQKVPDNAIEVLIDEDATKETILNAIKKKSLQTSEDGNFTFFFSGHPYPNGVVSTEGDLISYNDLLLALKESKAKHNLLIISGSYVPKVKEIVDDKTTVWFAADEGQSEVIGNELFEQSTFGYFLIKGLKGAANANDDQIISFSELSEYVRINVELYSNNYQEPRIINFAPMEWQIIN